MALARLGSAAAGCGNFANRGQLLILLVNVGGGGGERRARRRIAQLARAQRAARKPTIDT